MKCGSMGPGSGPVGAGATVSLSGASEHNGLKSEPIRVGCSSSGRPQDRGNGGDERRNRDFRRLPSTHWSPTGLDLSSAIFETWACRTEGHRLACAYLAIGVPTLRGITSGVGPDVGSNRTLPTSPSLRRGDGLWHSGSRWGVPVLRRPAKARRPLCLAFDLA